MAPWLLLPFLLVLVLAPWAGANTGRGPRRLASPLAPVRWIPPSTAILGSLVAPPGALRDVALPGGWRATWLSTLDDAATHALAMRHAIHAYLEPLMLAGVPAFGYRVHDATGRARGTFLLRWVATPAGHYEVTEAQGRDDQPLDTDTTRAVVAFYQAIQALAQASA